MMVIDRVSDLRRPRHMNQTGEEVGLSPGPHHHDNPPRMPALISLLFALITVAFLSH